METLRFYALLSLCYSALWTKSPALAIASNETTTCDKVLNAVYIALVLVLNKASLSPAFMSAILIPSLLPLIRICYNHGNNMSGLLHWQNSVSEDRASNGMTHLEDLEMGIKTKCSKDPMLNLSWMKTSWINNDPSGVLFTQTAISAKSPIISPTAAYLCGQMLSTTQTVLPSGENYSQHDVEIFGMTSIPFDPVATSGEIARYAPSSSTVQEIKDGSVDDVDIARGCSDFNDISNWTDAFSQEIKELLKQQDFSAILGDDDDSFYISESSTSHLRGFPTTGPLICDNVLTIPPPSGTLSSINISGVLNTELSLLVDTSTQAGLSSLDVDDFDLFPMLHIALSDVWDGTGTITSNDFIEERIVGLVDTSSFLFPQFGSINLLLDQQFTPSAMDSCDFECLGNSIQLGDSLDGSLILDLDMHLPELDGTEFASLVSIVVDSGTSPLSDSALKSISSSQSFLIPESGLDNSSLLGSTNMRRLLPELSIIDFTPLIEETSGLGIVLSASISFLVPSLATSASSLDVDISAKADGSFGNLRTSASTSASESSFPLPKFALEGALLQEELDIPDCDDFWPSELLNCSSFMSNVPELSMTTAIITPYRQALVRHEGFERTPPQ
ncbi:hypothetical protein K439DRAFT_1659251 [Ramaria rubella]|nr:hypothetical protein K439DRAFT_1659251 [Ramaria rubella]